MNEIKRINYLLNRHFSIDHDKDQVIPMVKRAMAKRGSELKFFSSPWSPPAWMKRNGDMKNSDKPGLIQDPKIFQAYALYLSKYISAYEAEGIPIWGMTVQSK